MSWRGSLGLVFGVPEQQVGSSAAPGFFRQTALQLAAERQLRSSRGRLLSPQQSPLNDTKEVVCDGESQTAKANTDGERVYDLQGLHGVSVVATQGVGVEVAMRRKSMDAVFVQTTR
jgi:hypothetical protein